MRKFLSCILVVAIIAAMAMSVSASNSDCCEAGLIGTPSAEELAFSAQKGNAVMRIMEIREKYIENGGQISDEERNEIERLIAIYYPKASIFDYLPMMGTRSNIGDHQVKYLDLPGKVHERQFAEDGGTTAPPCVRNNDHQSFDGHPLGYAHHRSGAVFYSHNGDDRIIR